MKTIRQALKNALKDDTVKLVQCVRIERLDGVVHRWTDHDEKLEMANGAVYIPEVGGADQSKITSTASVDNVDVDIAGPLIANGVKREDLIGGRFDFARVYLFRTLFDDPVEDDDRQATGWWATTVVKDDKYTAEFKSLAGMLENEIGFTHMPTCRHELGDSICRVDLTNGSNSEGNFTVTGNLTEIVDSVTLRDSNRSEPDDHFGAGFIEMTSGENEGIKTEIDSFTQSNGEFKLWNAFPFPVANGDSYKAVVGCRKRRDEDCKNKFDNVINYGGFPDLPGPDVENELGDR